MRVLSLALLVLASACSPPVRAIQRVAFGSCISHTQEAPLLDQVVAARPDLFLLIGDAIYPDLKDDPKPGESKYTKVWPGDEVFAKRLRTFYERLDGQPGFRRLRESTPLMAVWDDHDYGVNDGDASFPQKALSQELFLDFAREPAASERRATPGIYTHRTLGPEGRRVQVILLDVRYFRTPPKPDKRSKAEKNKLNIAGRYTPNNDAKATILGDAQWRWLQARLREPAELRLIVSSYPLVATELGRDSWANVPAERARLFALIGKTKASGVVFLSGDVHFSELSRSDEGPYPLYELTSSALAAPSRGNESKTNSRRVGSAYAGVNFGLIEIDWSAERVTLSTIGLDGGAKLKRSIPLKDLR